MRGDIGIVWFLFMSYTVRLSVKKTPLGPLEPFYLGGDPMQQYGGQQQCMGGGGMQGGMGGGMY